MPAGPASQVLIHAAMANSEIATALERCAELLAVQQADPNRVRAYRAAAHSVRTYPGSVAAVAHSCGREALDKLYGVGKSIAAAVEQLVLTGRWSVLERVEGAVSTEQLFTSVPGIGEELAARIHDQLGIDTLHELEVCAHDGRLEKVPGFGPRRVRAVQTALASMLSGRARSLPVGSVAQTEEALAPSVEALLEIDARYRNLAEEGALPRIAPRRFNAAHEARLPILHDEVEGFHVTSCSLTPRSRTSSGGRTTGSSSITTATAAAVNTRSSQSSTDPCAGDAWCAGASRSRPSAMQAKAPCWRSRCWIGPCRVRAQHSKRWRG